jgi:hypothetical protein
MRMYNLGVGGEGGTETGGEEELLLALGVRRADAEQRSAAWNRGRELGLGVAEALEMYTWSARLRWPRPLKWWSLRLREVGGDTWNGTGVNS